MNPHDLHHFLRSGYLYSSRAITREVCSGELMPGQPKILEFLLIHDGCTQREISQGCLLHCHQSSLPDGEIGADHKETGGERPPVLAGLSDSRREGPGRLGNPGMHRYR